MKRRLAALTLTLLLGACTVGPDYKLPDAALFNAPAAQGRFLASGERALTDDTLPAHWWRLYDDPKLDALIAQAFAANTDLRVAEANLERSHALLREARTLREPSVALGGGVLYSQPAGEQYLLRATPPANTDYEVAGTIGYDLDLFGRIKRGIEATDANDEAVAAARDLVEVNVAAQTALAYAGACGAGLELAAVRRSLALQRDSLRLVTLLRRGGRATDLDVTRSRQLVDQIATAIPALEAARRNALYRLATLTGRPPAQFDRDLEQCSTPPRLAQPLPAGDGAQLLKRRPDIRAAERQLAAATAQIGVATAQLYPDISLGVSGGSIGITPDAFTSPTNFWNFGVLINWQANQSAARARIAAADAVAKGALARFDGTVLGALKDAETALNVYVHDLRREALSRSARDQAAQAARDARRLEIAGRANALAVLDAQRTLAAAEQALAQIQAAIPIDQVNVFLALGGGWEAG
ncbi:MAG TPA: efflux transporter outer membrane subunit [Rhizomicrobium sp.]